MKPIWRKIKKGSGAPENTRVAYIALVRDIAEFPVPDEKGVRLKGELKMKYDTGLTEVSIVNNGREYSYESFGELDSRYYKTKFICTHPGTEQESLEFSRSMLGEDFIIMIPGCSADEPMKILGDPDAPLEFTSSHKSTKDWQKFTFTFEQYQATENVYYLYGGRVPDGSGSVGSGSGSGPGFLDITMDY